MHFHIRQRNYFWPKKILFCAFFIIKWVDASFTISDHDRPLTHDLELRKNPCRWQMSHFWKFPTFEPVVDLSSTCLWYFQLSIFQISCIIYHKIDCNTDFRCLKKESKRNFDKTLNIVLFCVNSINNRTDIFWHVTEMSMTYQKSAKLQGKKKSFQACIFFFVHAIHLSCYEELMNALINKKCHFFLWVFLWYTPHAQCVGHGHVFSKVYKQERNFCEMLATYHQHFQLR